MCSRDAPSAVDAQWSKFEFAGVSFGDKRLDMRFQRTVGKLSEQPLSSINQACGDWAASKAAYRLFDNDKVDTKKILAPHQQKTGERIKGHSQVLVIQDTSFINYTEHMKTKGLGAIGYVKKKKNGRGTQGLIMHTALAVSTAGVALGILDQEIWARDDSKPAPLENKKRKRVPIEQKESYKWLRALSGYVPLIPPGVQAITVCDRESDMYEFIGRAESLKTHYLVRSSWDRAIQADHEDYYLWDYMADQKVMGTIEVEVEAKRVGQKMKKVTTPSRTATLEVRFSRVELRRNRTKKMDYGECPPLIPSYVVWVKETKPPEGVEPLEWMLLTNVPVESLEDAIERVNWYKLRWHIESFHKVLKSGCNVELCRLETAERLERYLTLFSIIAWRLYWMTHISRASPATSCTELLADHEWKALYCKIKKTRELPPSPPTMREAIRWIASLGGFLGRKGDGEPGITTTWRGWQRLIDLSDSWLIFNS